MNFNNLINQKCDFLFYDYETFGVHTALDKPVQFASIRTDYNFNIIDDNVSVFYCAPPNDYLPNPESVLITGITPQYAIKKGLNEFYFARKIYSILNTKFICVIGYNNIVFDDEITRNIFYRNFFDPYSWSWKNYNSRWDLINVVRACYLLRPEGIVWPKNKLGFVSFKLHDLTRSNHINHYDVHNAASDVLATVSLAKLVKLKQPKLFNYLFKYRLKDNLKLLINKVQWQPLVYISGIFGNIRNNMTCIVPIFWNIKNFNMLVFFDLYMDSHSLVDFLLENRYRNNITISKLFSFGIGFLYINQCPILVPVNLLDHANQYRLNINLNSYLNKIYFLRKNIFLFYEIRKLFSNFVYCNANHDVDLQIYRSFFSNYDKKQMRIIHTISINDLKNISINFFDSRLYEMFFRYRARNFPQSLNCFEKIKWLLYRLKKFNKNFLERYFDNLNQLMNQYSKNLKKINLLNDLKRYVQYFIQFK
ncbi:exodeoxyribonuclease I [Buchnera aphidicola]|uniref:Exodeoxyribonuclease I n=1 Tax=Buchnera aphidicola (Stegophylla sp.) TaxID=2315800 RepID=A0A4D6YLI4_9GAMM|nr:exodeoxyribonuclease I [Buchnera aphidicola (Stegophylla sp.)]QCI26508.1 exodeoxyribonuclease I [Buchnera aphidicola (Stegophylla sp.)]